MGIDMTFIEMSAIFFFFLLLFFHVIFDNNYAEKLHIYTRTNPMIQESGYFRVYHGFIPCG